MGDRLSKDLVRASVFEGWMGVELCLLGHVDGVRDSKMDEESSKGVGKEEEAETEEDWINGSCTGLCVRATPMPDMASGSQRWKLRIQDLLRLSAIPESI